MNREIHSIPRSSIAGIFVADKRFVAPKECFREARCAGINFQG
jgi:hypothetical protein